MRMNWNAVRKRVEALEQDAAFRRGDGDCGELLSSQDMAFLIVEQRRLSDEQTPEAAILSARIDEIMLSHRKALKFRRPAPLSPCDAHNALIDAARRDGLLDDLSPEEQEQIQNEKEKYRNDWMKRLGAEREYIREVGDTLDSLKG